MTIRRHIDADALSNRLSNFEACAEYAPKGTYQREKDIRDMLGNLADELIIQCRALGLEAPNCDQIREVEAIMYGYVADANPLDVASGEGFGQTMREAPVATRERVIAQAASNLAFLRSVGAVD